MCANAHGFLKWHWCPLIGACGVYRANAAIHPDYMLQTMLGYSSNQQGSHIMEWDTSAVLHVGQIPEKAGEYVNVVKYINKLLESELT